MASSLALLPAVALQKPHTTTHQTQLQLMDMMTDISRMSGTIGTTINKKCAISLIIHYIYILLN